MPTCPAKKIFYSDVSIAYNELLDARIENKTTVDREAMSLGLQHTGLAVWDTDLEGLYVWQDDHWTRVGANPQDVINWNQAYDDSVIDFTISQATDTVFTIYRRNSLPLAVTYHSGYVHTQASPSNTWVVNHNLNKNPSITIVDSSGEEVIGAVTVNSLNQVTITFVGAFSGRAFLN